MGTVGSAPFAAPLSSRAETRGGNLFYYPFHVVVIGCVAIVGYWAVSLGLYEPRISQGPIAIGSGLAVIGLVVYSRYALCFPWLSASVVYLALFWIFHFGLAFTV